jgi:hypothetical protein
VAEVVPEPVLAAAGCAAAAADPVAPVAAETADPTADVAVETGLLPGLESWAGLAGAEAPVVAGDVAAEGAEAAADAGAEAAAVPVLDAAGCAGAADPVTAEAADPTVDVAAEVAPLPAPELADGVADAVGVAGAAVLAAAGWAGADDPAVPVAVEAADVTEEVADEAVDVTAEVADVTADVGESAACACFDSPSKTATMPTVKIAIWTARRARCRNVGWDTEELPLGRERRRDRTSHDNHLQTRSRNRLRQDIARKYGSPGARGARVKAVALRRSRWVSDR